MEPQRDDMTLTTMTQVPCTKREDDHCYHASCRCAYAAGIALGHDLPVVLSRLTVTERAEVKRRVHEREDGALVVDE